MSRFQLGMSAVRLDSVDDDDKGMPELIHPLSSIWAVEMPAR